jgi:hypothetical protein
MSLLCLVFSSVLFTHMALMLKCQRHNFWFFNLLCMAIGAIAGGVAICSFMSFFTHVFDDIIDVLIKLLLPLVTVWLITIWLAGVKIGPALLKSKTAKMLDFS